MYIRASDNDRAYQSHKPFSVGFFIKCSYDNSLSEYKSYRQEREEAESPAKWFVQSLHTLAVKLNNYYKNSLKRLADPPMKRR